MSRFNVGQRWICTAELDLGLGTVIEVNERIVRISFPASICERNYSVVSAPLARVQFDLGDEIANQDDEHGVVRSVHETNTYYTYECITNSGSSLTIDERDLNDHLTFQSINARFFSNQFEDNRLFDMRLETRLQQQRLNQSSLRGLGAARTSLLPHQLYIAHEVSRRYSPRVILADEVGLGKTIEAGLILNQLLITSRIQRVLIITPSHLLHQWIVELLRRFNISVSLYNEERYQSILHEQSGVNPFFSDQLILCSYDFLIADPDRFSYIENGEWDLLIVDEAHHLDKTLAYTSPEYQCVAKLAGKTRGILLLTATPEQLGVESHFNRLAILDPHRFNNLQQYIKEQQDYQAIADAILDLLDEKHLSRSSLLQITALIQKESNDHYLSVLNKLSSSPSGHPSDQLAQREELAEHLLDHYGTGRIFFRNSRETIKGFPERIPRPYKLNPPEQYMNLYNLVDTEEKIPLAWLPCPEHVFQNRVAPANTHWTSFDPRVDWLLNFLKSGQQEKMLVILAQQQSVIDLAKCIYQRLGIQPAIFYEQQSIIERDRSAAYFSDPENSTPILISSEIGSEGRNFQFLHHVVLFDLPLSVDVLEQRIGRLDRIGQSSAINIHIPYLIDTTQEILFHWYHDALNAFQQTCTAGAMVYAQHQTQLHEHLYSQDVQSPQYRKLLEDAKMLYEETTEQIRQGRNRLLEFNSCRPIASKTLLEKVKQESHWHTLKPYFERLLECYDIESEYLSEFTQMVKPIPHSDFDFTTLPHDGIAITFDRAFALANEDVHFITWDHPLVMEAMESLISENRGSCAMVSATLPLCKPGSLLLQCIFILESSGQFTGSIGKYIPSTMYQLLIDQSGKTHTSLLEQLNDNVNDIPEEIRAEILQHYAESIRGLFELGRTAAAARLPGFLDKIKYSANQQLDQEIFRLKSLIAINDFTTDEELIEFELLKVALADFLATAQFRLDAVRLIVTT